MIEKAATTNDPSNCTELQTLRFTEQNTSESGKAAIKSCEESAKEEEQAEKANVSNVSVNGEKATAEVEFIGGSLGSQTLAVALVEEDGDWKLDQIEGFAHYDGKALEESFLKRFEEDSEGLSKQQYTCIVEGIGKASAAEAEAMFLSGSSTNDRRTGRRLRVARRAVRGASRASRGGPGRLWPPRDARDVRLPPGRPQVRHELHASVRTVRVAIAAANSLTSIAETGCRRKAHSTRGASRRESPRSCVTTRARTIRARTTTRS